MMRTTRMLLIFLAILVAMPVHAEDPVSSTSPTGLCAVSAEIEKWYRGVEIAPLFRGILDEPCEEFARLCRTQPNDEELASGQAQVWLSQADAAAQHLADVLVAQITKVQTRESLNRNRLIALAVYHVQYRLNGMRALAYQAVREVPKEVEKVVERVVVERNPRDVACRNAVQANIGEAQAFLATILQENNPFAALLQEAAGDSNAGQITRMLARTRMRERIEVSLDSLRSVRDACSY